MRTEAGKMPGSLIFPIRNGHGASNGRFGLKCAGVNGEECHGAGFFGNPGSREQTVSSILTTGFGLYGNLYDAGE